MKILKNIYDFLSSYKLAMALLVTILSCCLFGVTVLSREDSWVYVFSSLWFNSILVLLVINVACCFFGRIWGRRLTLISVGMILFHLSFVVILGGIVYNSLFYFRGIIRLTEGETLPSGELVSYDEVSHGRFFSFSQLKGETTLIKMHTGYKVDGRDKHAAYEISVGEEGLEKEGIIYLTKNLKHNGFRYFNDREGYSILTILYDKNGSEIYAAHIPLQSLLQDNDDFLYTTGTKDGVGSLHFPQGDVEPIFYLQAAYIPKPEKERVGDIYFKIFPLDLSDAPKDMPPLAKGKVSVGEKFDIGDYDLSVDEVRYWVAMTVRYDPGLPVVLTFLWVSLGGMVITFIGRIRRGR